MFICQNKKPQLNFLQVPMWIQWSSMRQLYIMQHESARWTWSKCWWSLEPTLMPATTWGKSLLTTLCQHLLLTPASHFMKVSQASWSSLFFCFWIMLTWLIQTLSSHTDNPLSLQQLCRISIRTALGTRASEIIGQLDISHRLHSFLQYCGHPSIQE